MDHSTSRKHGDDSKLCEQENPLFLGQRSSYKHLMVDLGKPGFLNSAPEWGEWSMYALDKCLPGKAICPLLPRQQQLSNGGSNQGAMCLIENNCWLFGFLYCQSLLSWLLHTLPTWAWKITCQRFDWKLQLSSGQKKKCDVFSSLLFSPDNIKWVLISNWSKLFKHLDREDRK